MKLQTSFLMSFLILAAASFFSQIGHSAEQQRKIALEIDMLSPASAAIQTNKGNPSSMWGGAGDFNLGSFSTGPSIWVGNFSRKGDVDSTESVRREDLQNGEIQKIDAVRFRWTVAVFEIPENQRGWYLRAGYSYLRVNSRAKRFADDLTNPFGLDGAETIQSNISDVRHGVVAGFGERWNFWDRKASVTLGLNYTANFKRTVSEDSDSEDPNARRDYDEMIETIPDANMSVRGMPEVGLQVGFLL